MAKGKGLVLLVEDEYMKKIALAEAIKKAGYQVRPLDPEKFSAEEVEKIKPELIITDLDDRNRSDICHLICDIRERESIRKTEVFILREKIDVQTEVALRKLKIISYFLQDGETTAIATAVDSWFRPVQEEDYEQWCEQKYADELSDEEQFPEDVFDGHTEYTPAKAVTQKRPAPATSSADDEVLLEDMFGDMRELIGSAIDKQDGDVTGKSHAQTSFEVAVDLLEREEFESAAKLFEGMQDDPQFGQKACLKAAIAWRKYGDIQKAFKLFQAGFKRGANETDKKPFRYGMGDILDSVGKYREAFNMFGLIYKSDAAYLDVRKRLIELKKRL